MATLKHGDTGDGVKALQRILKQVGVFTGEIGGNFLDKTEGAVKAFQRLHNGPGGNRLAATGKVADATWWALQNLDESRAKPPQLKHGDKGEDVKALQRLLTTRGVFTAHVGGNFLDKTKAAVVAFQQGHVGPDGNPLQADGVATEDTWWALLHPGAARAGSENERPTLYFGDSGDAVKELQQILKDQGAFRGAVKGNFRKLTDEAVRYFQETHLGPDGHFLDVDGIVGPATWWALRNPSGPAQASDLDWDIPDGIGRTRNRQLEIVLRERQAGVKEDPDGANWGGGVERYGGTKGAPWCCYFWSWGSKQALKRYPLGAKLGLCMTAWQRAQHQGKAHSKDGYVPVPGDAFVMLYRNDAGEFTGRGHIGFVLRVEVVDNKATAIDTVEGNAGNRVKVGHRLLSSSSIVGFINPFAAEDQPTGWETGLGRTDVGGRDTTV